MRFFQTMPCTLLPLCVQFACEGLSFFAKNNEDHGTHRHPFHWAASTTSWASLHACLFLALWIIFDNTLWFCEVAGQEGNEKRSESQNG